MQDEDTFIREGEYHGFRIPWIFLFNCLNVLLWCCCIFFRIHLAIFLFCMHSVIWASSAPALAVSICVCLKHFLPVWVTPDAGPLVLGFRCGQAVLPWGDATLLCPSVLIIGFCYLSHPELSHWLPNLDRFYFTNTSLTVIHFPLPFAATFF